MSPSCGWHGTRYQVLGNTSQTRCCWCRLSHIVYSSHTHCLLHVTRRSPLYSSRDIELLVEISHAVHNWITLDHHLTSSHSYLSLFIAHTLVHVHVDTSTTGYDRCGPLYAPRTAVLLPYHYVSSIRALHLCYPVTVVDITMGHDVTTSTMTCCPQYKSHHMISLPYIITTSTTK